MFLLTFCTSVNRRLYPAKQLFSKTCCTRTFVYQRRYPTKLLFSKIFCTSFVDIFIVRRSCFQRHFVRSYMDAVIRDLNDFLSRTLEQIAQNLLGNAEYNCDICRRIRVDWLTQQVRYLINSETNSRKSYGTVKVKQPKSRNHLIFMCKLSNAKSSRNNLLMSVAS